jgi:hypothetical protein
MWALKMKPIKRERWETCFDRRDIWFRIFYTVYYERRSYLWLK